MTSARSRSQWCSWGHQGYWRGLSSMMMSFTSRLMTPCFRSLLAVAFTPSAFSDFKKCKACSAMACSLTRLTWSPWALEISQTIPVLLIPCAWSTQMATWKVVSMYIAVSSQSLLWVWTILDLIFYFLLLLTIVESLTLDKIQAHKNSVQRSVTEGSIATASTSSSLGTAAVEKVTNKLL